jgi:SPP1 family predicted phage head-tail adaptor
MLSAGKLRHRVDIERKHQDQDPTTGEMITAWVPFAQSIPAAVEPLSAREFIQSAAVQSEITTRITVRWLPGVQPDMRVVHGDNRYNIRGVLPDKNSGREYLTLPCDEVQG